MGLVRLAVPAALLLWFLWKARTNRLFLLGIPILMVMGSSVFFLNMKIFWKPGRFAPVTLLMMWLVIVWVVTMLRKSPSGEAEPGPFGVGRVLPEELPLIGIALLIGLHCLAVFAGSGDLSGAVSLASGTFYLVFGYLLIRGIASRATRAETMEFLAGVVIANTVACGLFVLHQGLHLPIYLGQYNITYTVGASQVSRATVFAPMFNLLALGFVLAKQRWTPKWLVVLAITLLAIMVSLTRTQLIAAAAGLVLAIIGHELSRPDFSRFTRRVGAVVVASVVVILAFMRLAPTYWKFLLKRFSELTSSSQGGAQVSNWHLRVLHWDAVERVVARADLALGMGFPKAGSNAVDSHIFSWSSDMAWMPIMYHFGYIGLALVALLFVGFMARSLWLSLKPPEERRELCLAFFITLALTVIMSFQMWTFMEPSIYPMGLWLMAFVAVEALRQPEEARLPVTALAQPAADSVGAYRPHAQSS